VRCQALDLPAGTTLVAALAEAKDARAIPAGREITVFEIQTDEGVWPRPDGRPFLYTPEKAAFKSWAELDAEVA
jgi:hypothetical protein